MGRVSEKLAAWSDGLGADQASDVVQVVARAFDIMRCFDGAHISLANRDICRITELPPSTVSRLTNTLTQIGQLAYSPEQRRYQLGTAALAMSSSMLRGLQSRAIIKRLMSDVADEVPGTIAMTVRDGLDMVLVECCRSAETVGVQADVGSRKPVALTASGRVYLLATSEARRRSFLADYGRKSVADARKLTRWLRDNEATFREEGIAISCGEENPYISGVATTFWSETHGDHMVLSAGVLSTVYDADRLRKEVAPKLLKLRSALQQLSPTATS